MNITIASGKGGTGKTTFAVNLACLLSREKDNVRLLDGDVEEPNAHLFVSTAEMTETAVTVLKPKLDQDKCTGCGKCVEACGYNALALVRKKLIFFPELCHSCGACSYVCPTSALTEEASPIGKIYAAPATEQRAFYFAYGLLNIGEALAPAVVKKLKEHLADGDSINILDAAPGTACPVVEAMKGSGVTVLVTEPTPFGLNDLKLAAELAIDLGIPTGIVINRSDGKDAIIANFAAEHDIPILGRIPFARKYAETYSRGQIMIDHHPELVDILASTFSNIKKLAGTAPGGKAINTVMPAPEEFANFAKGSADDYREIVVISGKGGTGKTTIASSLAKMFAGKVVFDADVDAADLHLLLKPQTGPAHRFSGSDEFTIDPTVCFGCGKCAAACHFDAITLSGPGNDLIAMTYEINELACEGCALCRRVCPVDAISAKPAHTGDWYTSAIGDEALVHAKLGVGSENSGKLVAHVKEQSAILAKQLKQPLILGDGPPGTGCPVIASVSGADLILLVTEPTVSGVHDLRRILELVQHFEVKSLVIINKADLNREMTAAIHAEAEKFASKVIEEIPFDRNIHDSLMSEVTIIEYGKGEAAKVIAGLKDKIMENLAIPD